MNQATQNKRSNSSWKLTWKFLSRFLLLNVWSYLGFGFFALVYASLSIANIFLMREFQNIIVTKTNLSNNINVYGAIIFTILIVLTFVQFGLSSLVTCVSESMGQRIGNYTYAKILRAPMRYFDQIQTGDIMARLDNDLANVIQNTALLINQLGLNLFMMLAMFVGMFLVSTYLGLLVIGLVPLALLGTGLIIYKSTRYYKSRQRALGALNGFLEEAISGQKEIKLFHQAAWFQQRFEALNQKYTKAAYQADFWFGFLFPWNTFINNLTTILVILVGVLLAFNLINPVGILNANLNHDLKLIRVYPVNSPIHTQAYVNYFATAIVILNTFLLLMRNFNAPLFQMINSFNGIQSLLSSIERLDQVDQQPHEYLRSEKYHLQIVPTNQAQVLEYHNYFPEGQINWQVLDQYERSIKPWVKPIYEPYLPVAKVHPVIKVVNLSFAYQPNQLVLKNLNFEVLAGQFVAVVGATGSGKSTLMNLLTKFYEVDQGEIYFGNRSIKELTKTSVRTNLGIVQQDNVIFADTVKNNFKYGNLQASDQAINQAIAWSQADHFISQLAEQADTYISENDQQLSHGQKQLLGIGRVMLANAPLLIFDEATSSVDISTERAIKLALKQLLINKTAFVIAHRLSTIIDADLILVLDQGKLVEQGTHEQLLKQNGWYAQMYAAQTQQ